MSTDDWNTRLTLLEKIKDRYDGTAWEEFVHYYQKYIFIILNGMGMPPGDAEELGQQIMIKLWEKLPDFEYQRGVARFRTWLCRVVQNQARNFMRNQNVRRSKSCGDALEYQLEIPSESELEQLAEREWNIYVAKLAWNNVSDKMPEHYKEVFKLHANGKSTKEIEEETGLTSNAINVYLKRCRDRLKEEVKRLTDELL